MNGQQLIDKFHNYVSDELDTDFELQLANDAKNAVESELMMEITKKVDSSSQVTSGQDSTVQRSLPADFYLPLPIYVGQSQYFPVPFERQQDYKDMGGVYWIDIANDSYYLAGDQTTSDTVYFYYQYATPDLTLSTAPVWPDRFHTIIPLEMARIYWQIDQGEKSRAWTPEYEAEYMRWKSLMTDWDHKLKLNGLGYSTLPLQSSVSENRINF